MAVPTEGVTSDQQANWKTVYVASYGGPGGFENTVTPISTATNKAVRRSRG